MGKRVVLSVMLALAVRAIAPAADGRPRPNETIPPLAKPDGTFIRTWLLCGPFPNPPNKPRVPGRPHIYDHTPPCIGLDTDYLKEHGGEAKIAPSPGMKHTGPGGRTVKWFPYTSRLWKIPFRVAITRQSNVVAYAYGEVAAQKAGPYLMTLGSDEGVRVWINGRPVHYRLLQRAIVEDDDIVPVTLKKGRNRILVKVEQGWGGWGFAMRFLPKGTVIATATPDNYLGMLMITVRSVESGKRQPFSVVCKGKKLAEGVMLADDPAKQQATGMVEVPFPPDGKELGLLTIVLDGQTRGRIRVGPLKRLLPEDGQPGESSRFHEPKLF